MNVRTLTEKALLLGLTLAVASAFNTCESIGECRVGSDRRLCQRRGVGVSP